MTTETPMVWSFQVLAGENLEVRILLPKKPMKSTLFTVSSDQQLTFSVVGIMTNGKYQIKRSGVWSDVTSSQKIFGDVELKTSGSNAFFDFANNPEFEFTNSGSQDANVSVVINYNTGV